MTLSIRMEIEVNVSAWRAEYGTPGDTRDVEDYLLANLTQCPAAEAGCFTVAGFAVEPA